MRTDGETNGRTDLAKQIGAFQAERTQLKWQLKWLEFGGIQWHTFRINFL